MRFLSILTTVVPALAVSGFAESGTPINGEYIELRSAEVYTCGCLFSGQAETAGREAILAWNIHGGSIQGVSLAGVRMAAVVVGDSHLAAYPSRPRSSCVYLDPSLSPPQREAALEYLASRHSNILGPITAVREAPISFRRDNDRWYVRVGEVAEIVAREARLPEDAHPGSSQWYSPFVSLKSATLATAVAYRYSGSEHSSRWHYQDAGITGFFGVF